MKSKLILCSAVAAFILAASNLNAQTAPATKSVKATSAVRIYKMPKISNQVVSSNHLFTAGYANAFIGGLYDGFFPYWKLKQHGNFGLGAPDKLDGELLVLNGKIYQTQHTGKTFQVNDKDLTPFAVVNFFHPDKTIKLEKQLNKTALYAYLDSITHNSNGVYAIHLKGSFKYIKTRAFPAVTDKPYTPLAQLLDKQHFFEYKSISGDFVGYNLPSYMEGANITGYHFHFLSADTNSGGHVIDFITDNVTIEIDYLSNFTVDLPQTADFKAFDFNKDRSDEVKSVETGKKN